MREFDELVEEITAATIEASKFAHGNKAAGVRLRAHMQTVKALAQEIRVAVTGSKE